MMLKEEPLIYVARRPVYESEIKPNGFVTGFAYGLLVESVLAVLIAVVVFW